MGANVAKLKIENWCELVVEIFWENWKLEMSKWVRIQRSLLDKLKVGDGCKLNIDKLQARCAQFYGIRVILGKMKVGNSFISMFSDKLEVGNGAQLDVECFEEAENKE